ncbi:hypothetical protein E4U55_003900, partial [Claviceps digitariae]
MEELLHDSLNALFKRVPDASSRVRGGEARKEPVRSRCPWARTDLGCTLQSTFFPQLSNKALGKRMTPLAWQLGWKDSSTYRYLISLTIRQDDEVDDIDAILDS